MRRALVIMAVLLILGAYLVTALQLIERQRAAMQRMQQYLEQCDGLPPALGNDC